MEDAKGPGIDPGALRTSAVLSMPNEPGVPPTRYFFATLFAADLAGAADDVDFGAALRDVEPVLALPGLAAVRRAGARTSSSWPGWMTCFLRPLSRTSALALVPYFFAMP